MATYEATGGIGIYGCAGVKVKKFYISKYNVGNVLYTRPRAIKGRLEKVAIKKVMTDTDGVPLGLYKDTLNSFWNENELLNLAEAMQYIAAYQQKLAAQTLAAVKTC